MIPAIYIINTFGLNLKPALALVLLGASSLRQVTLFAPAVIQLAKLALEPPPLTTVKAAISLAQRPSIIHSPEPAALHALWGLIFLTKEISFVPNAILSA